MTVRESNALISHRNDKGDREILYPITLSDYVDGLDEELDKKVSKEDGKGLSQYDFDESSKEKLGSIEYGAEVNVQSDWLERNVSSPAYIKNKPEIKEGERYTLSKKGKDIVLKGSNGTLSSAENIIYEHPESGVVSGTYKSVVVDSKGHVTNGTNPTTLEGYGITNADKLGSADKALSAAKSYTDSKISSLIGGAPETLDTLEEVANAIENNKSVVDALNSAIGEKVSKVEGKGLSTNDLSDELKSNYDSAYAHSQENHAPSNAQENVIESIKVNGTSVVPVSKVVNITSESLGIGDVNDALVAIGKCNNMLKPTLATTTQNGVTCTNNGDGTYTLNGTASADCYFILNSNFNLESGKSYKLIGNPGKSDGSSSGSDYRLDFYNGNTYIGEYGRGAIITAGTTNKIQIIISNGVTISNILFKPMLTTNLNATYDDFVPYTGSTGQLNSDVAEIRKTYLTLSGGTVTGTLSAGSTSITLSDSLITTDSTLDFYTSIYGVSPKTVSVASGSVTLTFKAQTTDVKVKVVIK